MELLYTTLLQFGGKAKRVINKGLLCFPHILFFLGDILLLDVHLVQYANRVGDKCIHHTSQR